MQRSGNAARLLNCGTREEVERMAAEAIAAALRRRATGHDRVFLALPGGRSIAGVLRQLQNLDVPWRALTVLPADERCLPEGDRERNWEIIRAELLDPLIARGAMHEANGVPFRYRGLAPDWGIGDFAAALDLPLTADGVPRIDVVVLGAGEDGHVASLFPQSLQLDGSDVGFLQVHDSPKPPPRRVTLSPAMIAAAATCVLLFLGNAKHQALHAFIDPSTPIADCPARLATHAQRCLVFADTDAVGTVATEAQVATH